MVAVAKTTSPGLKSVVGSKVSVLPLMVAAPAFLPPACWLQTVRALAGPVGGWLRVTVTLVARLAALALRVGDKSVTVAVCASADRLSSSNASILTGR